MNGRSLTRRNSMLSHIVESVWIFAPVGKDIQVADVFFKR